MSAQWLFPVCNAGFRVTLRLFARRRIEGRENVPGAGPFIVVSSHLSNIDPAIVASVLPRAPGFLAKKELFKNPLLAFFMYGYGAYPVDRGKADRRALNWVVRRLRKGGCVILFPEGTRSRGEGLLEGQQGAALIAAMTGAPLVPVALTGSEPLQNLLKVFAPRANLTVRIGRPFKVVAGGERATRDHLDRATLEMMSRIARMLPPEYRGLYADSVDIPFQATADIDRRLTI